MNCIILGSRSDLAQSLWPMLADDYRMYGWHRDSDWFVPEGEWAWDLMIVALGTVAPVGPWWKHDGSECMESNLLLPLRILRSLWEFRNKDARVCFMAGSNPNKVHIDYSAYAIAKMALLKACEHLDAESDAVFFAMNPGYVDTKIHKPSLEAGIDLSGRVSTQIDLIYRCLKWCINQEKHVVGGRNICVSDDWENPWFADNLALNPNLLKLRRCE